MAEWLHTTSPLRAGGRKKKPTSHPKNKQNKAKKPSTTPQKTPHKPNERFHTQAEARHSHLSPALPHPVLQREPLVFAVLGEVDSSVPPTLPSLYLSKSSCHQRLTPGTISVSALPLSDLGKLQGREYKRSAEFS